MTIEITTAMVLAAGLGKRMRPLTDNMPKPMVPVQNKPLLAYTLDRLAAAGVKKAVVNVHYMADQVEKFLSDRRAPEIVISDERTDLLETGGALIKARHHFSNAPFFCTNTDAILIDNQVEACQALSAAWRDDQMDALLLLCRQEQASGYAGSGDFSSTDEGLLSWPESTSDQADDAYVFTGLQVIHPRLFADEPLRPISTKEFWDRAIGENRLYGIVYDGFWMHVGDQEGLLAAEQRLGSLC